MFREILTHRPWPWAIVANAEWQIETYCPEHAHEVRGEPVGMS